IKGVINAKTGELHTKIDELDEKIGELNKNMVTKEQFAEFLELAKLVKMRTILHFYTWRGQLPCVTNSASPNYPSS
ncbi:MAG: hypothetical protein VXU42_00385, partial [Verrucomicrobiota bacterium]|nr:hypothetical protein [Verrucomicrobiota bacterium]